MKKTVSFVVCILAAIFCFSGTIFAKEPTGLAEYGQQTVTLTDSFTPFVDGRIDEGEYEIVFTAVLKNDKSDESFYINGDLSLTEAEYVKYYVTADAENVYFAIEQKDPHRVGHYDALYLQVGVDSTDSYIQIYLPYNAPPEVLTEKDRTKWNIYYESYAASYSGDITLYEIAMPIETIFKTFGKEPSNEILVSLAHRVHYHPDEGHVIVTWGFQNDTLNGKHGSQGFPVYGYPHVLVLPPKLENDEVIVLEPIGETEILTNAPETEPATELATESSEESETETIDQVGCKASVTAFSFVIAMITAIAYPLLKKENN